MRHIILLAFVAYACSDDASLDAGADAGIDVLVDASGDDASLDASLDSGPTFDPERAEALCSVLDAFVAEQGVPGAVVGARMNDGATHLCAAGNASLAPERAMTTDDRFRIGSITKTFVAAAILLLSDDGVLSLEDPVSRWIPGFGTDPTIAQVLNHTSGFGEYLFDDALRSDAARAWDEEELLEIARSKPPTDEIGVRFRYSNTNYLVAGGIVSAAAGVHWSEFVRARLLEPLNLEDTFIAGFEPVAGGRVEGYDVSGSAPIEIASTFHQTVATSAGCLVSDADDLLTWAGALYGSDVLSASALTAMNQTYRVPHAHDDGIYEGSFVSLANFIGTDDDFGDVYGHAGGTPGFSANMRYLERDGITQVILINAQVSSDVEQALRGSLWEALLL